MTMVKSKSYIIPRLHLIMLLVSVSVLPLSIYSIADFWFTGSSFINPFVALGLFGLSIGWGGSVGLRVIKMD